MREGRAKKFLKTNELQATATSEASQKKQFTLEGEKYQPIRDLVPLHQTLAIPRIILKDGKSVIENPITEYEEKNQLIEVRHPERVTSHSFKAREHTDKWTPEENRKFYKVKLTLSYLWIDYRPSKFLDLILE